MLLKRHTNLDITWGANGSGTLYVARINNDKFDKFPHRHYQKPHRNPRASSDASSPLHWRNFGEHVCRLRDRLQSQAPQADVLFHRELSGRRFPGGSGLHPLVHGLCVGATVEVLDILVSYTRGDYLYESERLFDDPWACEPGPLFCDHQSSEVRHPVSCVLGNIVRCTLRLPLLPSLFVVIFS